MTDKERKAEVTNATTREEHQESSILTQTPLYCTPEYGTNVIMIQLRSYNLSSSSV